MKPVFYSFVFFLLIGGCVYYTTSERGRSSIRTLAVPAFDCSLPDETRLRLKEKITEIIRNTFVRDNRLRLVEQKEAEGLLSGQIVEYKREPFSYTTLEVVESYKFRIFAQVTYKDLKNDEIIWEEKNLEGWTIGSAHPDSESVEVEAAITKLAEDILRRIVEEW
ncbi:MAG: LPS assembly lipoprotein LptE [Candidatus Edwardsbacteria bacterium]